MRHSSRSSRRFIVAMLAVSAVFATAGVLSHGAQHGSAVPTLRHAAIAATAPTTAAPVTTTAVTTAAPAVRAPAKAAPVVVTPPVRVFATGNDRPTS